jgi:LacI family transcriptional regulator
MTRRIALIMNQDMGYTREVLRGVQVYGRHKPDWIFHDGPHDPKILPVLREWQPHGIIAHLFEKKFAEALLKLGIPTVNTTSTIEGLKAPLVEVDHNLVGRLAAEHYLEKGFSNFGFFGSDVTGFSRAREAGFRERLAESGFQVHSCYADYLPKPSIQASWKRIDQTVSSWLRRLPRPVAIFASNDVPARALATTCRHAGYRIPDEVSLLGVDNDELECHLSNPPLSSIDIPSQRIGYEAAKTLDSILSGKSPRQKQLYLPPLRLVTRQSTDTMAIEDRDVTDALAFIRAKAHTEFSVESILLEVPLSRRMLERKFQEHLGRTVLSEIRRVRIELAKGLLAETDLPMPVVARRCGFSGARRFAVVFRQVMGTTPTAYRVQAKISSE